MTSAAAARTLTHRIARNHDENFPLVFALLPPERREDMRNLYAYCRTVDDLGDSGPPEERLGQLEIFETDLHRAWDGLPTHPVLQELATTVRRHRLEPDPFLRLIEANRMDQRQRRWQTYGDLVHYCRHSATPVGEMVLAVLGFRDRERIALSDHTCIGLQLVNFWQDIRRDLADNGRIYLPIEDMERFGVTDEDIARPAATGPTRALIAFQVARARAELVAGAPLARWVPLTARVTLRMFTAGGLALCDAIARQRYDTLARRPAPGRIGRVRIAADVAMGMIRR